MKKSDHIDLEKPILLEADKSSNLPDRTLDPLPKESHVVNQSAKNLFSRMNPIYKYTIGSCVPFSSCSPFGHESAYSREVNEPKELLVDEIKTKVNRHFENHLKKWGQQKFPWKALFHLLLVILVTIQVISTHIA